ncbi:histidinol-phosphate transaminase [Candidatus Bipolaricaulota bacterium]|nr:histidinol-phosphate transaminase [Candidatus Bipolaricaulota bacterium]
MTTDSLRFLRDDVRQMSPYNVLSSVKGIALQRNEAPLELPETLRDEIVDRVRRLAWRRYPDLAQTSLRESAREALDLPVGMDVAFGNGSNELIQAVVAACIDVGSTAVIPQPTFSMYERMMRLAHGTPVLIPPRPDLGFDAAEILKAARVHSARIVFLCRPNNPTGGSMDLADVDWLATQLEALLVIDEAYVEFAHDDALPLAERYSNVLLLRTFSKALCSAGLRIGYAIGHTALIEQILKTLTPYNLGVMATETIRVALAHRSELVPNHAAIVTERQRLVAELKACEGTTILPSRTNFVCLRSARSGAELTACLASRGIYVRDLSAYPGLQDAIRITVSTVEEDDQLIEAIRTELEKT